MNRELKYSRVLLKLSGESLCPDGGSGVDSSTLAAVARELLEVQGMGVQLAVTIGGGNLLRGASLGSACVERVTADYMGMLATVMNGLALRDAIESQGGQASLLSAIPMGVVCDAWSGRRCRQHLEKGRIVILGAGTGNPFVTTDSGAAMRAAELNVDALLKATKVDGIYTADPKKDETATRYETLTYDEFLSKGLEALDLSAVAICRAQEIPVVLFNFFEPGNVARVVTGEQLGTRIVAKT